MIKIWIETIKHVVNNIVALHQRIMSAYYHRKEAIAEAKYNKTVIDFYENGIGYYGQ